MVTVSKKIWMVSICVVVLSLMVVLIPLLGLANEDKILKAELDNAYINNDFQSWRQVTFANTCSIYVPEYWQLQKNAGIYQISDSQNNVVAYGFVIPDGSTQFQYNQELEAIVGFKVRDTDRQYISDVISIGNSDFIRLEVYGDTRTEVFYRLRLNQSDAYTFMLFFPADGETEYSQLLEIVQAIMYSHEFSAAQGTVLCAEGMK